ncbi:MAG TPA: hypothetical protein VH157_03985 [Bryobacteraceae bacterium]|jgi:hypothetical protein|nr:hypothetical protein [Bryobacteraceae bacterium]
MGDGTAYGDARECIRAAKAQMRDVRDLLSKPSTESAERSAVLLRDIEVQLGCAAAILKMNGTPLDLEMRSEVEDLQTQVAVLAQFFAEADQLFSNWLRVIRTRRAGYTEHGHAAPLVLVNKLTVEG